MECSGTALCTAELHTEMVKIVNSVMCILLLFFLKKNIYMPI